MHRAGRVVDIDAGLEVLAGVVVQDEGGLLLARPGSAEGVDEGAGERHEASQSRQLLVGGTFQRGLAQQGFLRGSGGEERVAHLVKQHVAARVAVLEGQAEVLRQSFLQLARQDGQVVRFPGTGRPDQREDAVGHVQVARR